jgi:AcrR family transcriptional regulator
VVRITSEAKREVRVRILETARNLFSRNGFEQTTTRDIAADALIAAGTLFNYFPNKEALAMTLVAEALDEARIEFDSSRISTDSLEEELFAYAISGVRRLTPFRSFVGQVVETAMSPFTRADANQEGERIRVEHLETVGEIIARRTGLVETPAVTMHLYWSLYLGVLAFWSKDESPKQEESLVVLDQAMRLFASSLTSESTSRKEIVHGA